MPIVSFACLLFFSLSPKSALDIGGFQILVCQEQRILQPALDSYSSSDHSISPTSRERRPAERERRHIPVVNYEEPETSSSSDNKTPDDTLDIDEDDGKMCQLKTKCKSLS